MALLESPQKSGDPESEFENIWRTHPNSKHRACILHNEAYRHLSGNTQKIWYVGRKNFQQRITMQEKIF